MSTASHITSPNQLLAALPSRERERILADCTLVQLVLGSVLYEQGKPIRYVYFPTESFISLLTSVDRHSTLEVGMIGSEGMSGFTLMLGDRHAPFRAITQGAGAAWRMAAPAFLRHLKKTPSLRALLDRYVYVLLRQLAQTAACTRFHLIEKRLARWLLMTQDRAHANTFEMTQEFLAHMLGVRRVGVTAAAGALQSRKLIRYARGKITILSRPRLDAAACVCYRADLNTYAQGMSARL